MPHEPGWQLAQVHFKEGRVEISVQQQNGHLRYCVADTGIGIPLEKIGSLFTEFKQTDATIASEYGGTGLGLSITKKFIEMHGGRIWVESEIGKGSAFTFEIPLKKANEHCATPAGRKTILYVEDNEANRKMVRLLLMNTAYALLKLTTAKRAC